MGANFREVPPGGDTHAHRIHAVHKDIIDITRSTCLQKKNMSVLMGAVKNINSSSIPCCGGKVCFNIRVMLPHS